MQSFAAFYAIIEWRELHKLTPLKYVLKMFWHKLLTESFWPNFVTKALIVYVFVYNIIATDSLRYLIVFEIWLTFGCALRGNATFGSIWKPNEISQFRHDVSGEKLIGFRTFLPSSSCVPWAKTLSTLDGSPNVMNPNPLKLLVWNIEN